MDVDCGCGCLVPRLVRARREEDGSGKDLAGN